MSSKRFTASRYHLMSAAEKRAGSLATVREPAVTCPSCDTQLMPADLLAHLEQRCAGPREPGPGAKWINWREAIGINGVTPMRLSRWARNGHVRFVGERQDRKYLHRDLAVRVANMRGFRRR